MVFYTISFILIAAMFLLVPKNAFKINRIAAIFVTICFSFIYLFLLNNSSSEKIGGFYLYDILIFLTIFFLILYRPIKFSLLNMKENFMEFDLIHKALTLILLLIYVYLRNINIGLSWTLELSSWAQALLITLIGILISSFIAIKIKFVKLGWLKSDYKELFITSVNMFFFVALPEEIFFRGLIYSSLVQFTGIIFVSFIISIIVFGLAHLRYGIGMVLLGGLTGIFYGLVYILTGNLYCVAIMHTLVNLFRKYFLITNTNK
jgi:membrane protease YdiL (CAAX protease family)